MARQLFSLSTFLCALIIAEFVLAGCGLPPFAQGARFTNLAVPEEGHLSRYAYMRPFLIGRLDFHGLLHDTQNGTYAFWFHNSYEDLSAFRFTLMQNAHEHGWNVVCESENSILFRNIATSNVDNDVVCMGMFKDPPRCLFLMISEDAWVDSSWRSGYLRLIDERTGHPWALEVCTLEKDEHWEKDGNP